MFIQKCKKMALMLRPSFFLFCVVVGILVRFPASNIQSNISLNIVVPFVSMSASVMSAAAYSLALIFAFCPETFLCKKNKKKL